MKKHTEKQKNAKKENIAPKCIQYIAFLLLVCLILCGCAQGEIVSQNERFASATYCMSTVVDQKAYGSAAQEGMKAVESALFAFENEFSLYVDTSDVARINAAAGKEAVSVGEETLALLVQGKELALASDNAFALTIAPLSLAWGITSASPRVLTQQEVDVLLPLINDNDILIDETAKTVMLAHDGQGIDLGGIAKGTACNIAKGIYEEYGINSAVLSIGGNIYARGTKPDGSQYRVAFRDPQGDESSYIASFTMRDSVFAVSGGYERYFEQDGVRYIHIINPATGFPAQSDIVSVGVMNEDGTVADFMSTTLYVWGKEKALAYMRQGGVAVLLDAENNLYVSGALKDGFRLAEQNTLAYHVIYIEGE